MLTVMPFRVRDNDVAMLQGWTRSSSIRAGLAQRARIVLLSSEGLGTTAVAERIGVSRPTVILWRNRYLEGGVDALADLPRPGRKSDTDEAAIVVRTLEAPPRAVGRHALVEPGYWPDRWASATSRSRRVAEIRSAALADRNLQVLHRSRTRREGPRRRGLVLEPAAEGGSRLRGREIPGAGFGPDRADPAAATWPTEKRTHDYVRHGTTTLFAALNVATGQVTDACHEGHRHQEFLAFLPPSRPRLSEGAPARGLRQLHHPQAPGGSGLAGQAPTHPNALHPDLGQLAEHGRDLLRDHHPAGDPARHFTSVTDLVAAIGTFIDGWNERCQPFVWTKTADETLAHSKPRKRTSLTRH